MDIDTTDILDLTDAAPPAFTTRKRGTIVITAAEDFPDFTDAWNSAAPDDRAPLFWRLGHAHLAEVAAATITVEMPKGATKEECEAANAAAREQAITQVRGLDRSNITKYTAEVTRMKISASEQNRRGALRISVLVYLSEYSHASSLARF